MPAWPTPGVPHTEMGSDRFAGTPEARWPDEAVARGSGRRSGTICELAKVPVVCAHSMRGLHSTLAMDAVVTGHVVAASLGHESRT
ncbi:MAG TPA: hypothetical protein VMT03_16395 [Polyangia bacterium]|nr:hypothetical protein [Polyangia bacterium]